MSSTISTVTGRPLNFTEFPPEIILCIVDNMLEMSPDLEDKDARGSWEWDPLTQAEPKYNALQRYQDALNLALTCKDFRELVTNRIYRQDVIANHSAALLIAAKQGNIAALTRSLDANADINAGDCTESVRYHIWGGLTNTMGGFRFPIDLKDQVTALHWASYFGHQEIVRTLLSRGADVNHRVRIDTTEWLNRFGFVEAPKEFDVAEQSVLSQFPLRFCNRVVGENAAMTAAALDGIDTDTRRMVIEKGANPLYFAIQGGDYEMAELLILAGADLTTHLGTGINALHQAVDNCDLAMVRFLLDERIDPNVEDPYGSTPLHFINHKNGTMVSEARKIIKILAEYGARVNKWDVPGETPLRQHLTTEPHSTIITEFIRQGAHIHEGFHDSLKLQNLGLTYDIKKVLDETDNPDHVESMLPGWWNPTDNSLDTAVLAYRHFYMLVNQTDKIPKELEENDFAEWKTYWEKRPFAYTWVPTLGGLLRPPVIQEEVENRERLEKQKRLENGEDEDDDDEDDDEDYDDEDEDAEGEEVY